MAELCDACQSAMEIGCTLPCFEAGRVCPGKQPAKANLPVFPKDGFPVSPNEAFPVVSKEAEPNRIRISQNDGPAASPERSVSPETSHKSPEPTDSTFKRSPSRRRRTKSRARQLNHSGSLIRKIHDAHRGGFRRSSRLQSAQASPANKLHVAIEPVPLRNRPAPPPSPLKKCETASNSQRPAAPLRPGRPRGSKNNETTPRGTGSLLGSNARLQIAAVPLPEINCDCLSSALRILEELETHNHKIQDYSGPAISQHLINCLVRCGQILYCKHCIETSEMMIFMIIIAQKITKTFARLTTRFIEGDLLILSPEKEVPLPQLVLIQQLKLENLLNQLVEIARNRNWRTHIAMLASICHYSRDTMDRLRRINGLKTLEPILFNLNTDDPIVVDDE